MFFEVVVVLLKKKYCPSCSQQSTIKNFIEQTVIGSSSYIGFNISYSNKAAIIEFCSHRENAIISNLWLEGIDPIYASWKMYGTYDRQTSIYKAMFKRVIVSNHIQMPRRIISRVKCTFTTCHLGRLSCTFNS